jgi:hypothetical protein
VPFRYIKHYTVCDSCFVIGGPSQCVSRDQNQPPLDAQDVSTLRLPPFITAVKEVTHDKQYSMYHLSLKDD